MVFCSQSTASAKDGMQPKRASNSVHPTEILNVNNQFEAGVTGNWIDYLEHLGNMPFDKEVGGQLGLEVSGSLMRDWVFRNLYVYGQFKWSNGNTKYTGSYEGDPYGSLITSDGAEVTSESVRLGKGFAINDTLMLTPYLSAGARQWGRNSDDPGGYHEDYSHGYWGAGLLVQLSPAPRWVVSAHGLVGSTFGARLKTSDNGNFPIIPQSYGLGSSAIFIAGLSLDYAVTRHIHANVGIDYTHFKYGASARSPIDGSWEPDSKTSETTLKFGLGYAF